MSKPSVSEKQHLLPGEAIPDAEDVAAALADIGGEAIGFLPGSAKEKMRAFNGVVEIKHQERVARDSMAGVTSHPVKPMRTLRFRYGGTA